MQAASPGLKPDEERRLRNRALARWLIAAGPARLRLGRQQMKVELVVHNGRACAAVTGTDGQILALYPVSGSGQHRRLYKAVPIPANHPLPPTHSPISGADSAALRTRLRESHAVSLTQTARSRALCEAAALQCTRARALCAASLAQIPPRVALPAAVRQPAGFVGRARHYIGPDQMPSLPLRTSASCAAVPFGGS